MQQGGWRDCIGGITVPNHSSTTSKGSPLVHPLAEWQGLLSCLLTSSSAFSIWALSLWWKKLCDLVSQGHGHLFPLTQGRVRGCSLPTVKAGGYHSTGVVCVAWHDTRMQHYVCASKEIQGAAETSCVKTYDCLNMRTKCFDYMSNTRHLNQIQANQKQTKKNQTNKLRQTDHANHIYSPDCLLQFLRIRRDFKKGQLRLLGTAHRINMHLIKYKRHQ